MSKRFVMSKRLPELVFLTPAPVWQKLEPSTLASPGTGALHITSLPSPPCSQLQHPPQLSTDVPCSRSTTRDLFHYPLSFSLSCDLFYCPYPTFSIFTPACLLSTHPPFFRCRVFCSLLVARCNPSSASLLSFPTFPPASSSFISEPLFLPGPSSFASNFY